MKKEALSFLVLQKEAAMQLCRGAVIRGQASKILLLGAIGFALFLFFMPAYALFVLAATVGIAALSVWELLRNASAREQVIRSVIRSRFGSEEMLKDVESAHREEAEKGVEIFSEIAVKIAVIARAGGRNEDLFKVFADAQHLITLQIESARRVAELSRILRKIGSGREESRGAVTRRGGVVRASKDNADTEADALLRQNIAAIREDIAESEALVGEIGRKLETLMLQIAQLETRASDRVRIAEFAQESSENLERIQAAVEARRKTAEEYIAHTKEFHA